MPTIKQLEALVWIARLGSFERAADRIGASQSAISKRVKELEAACRVHVFDRSGREARLTDEGRRLVSIGEAMLRLAGEAAEIKQTKDAAAGVLRLGVTEFTALTWLPQFVARLRAEYPQTAIHPRVEMSATLNDLLMDDELDMAVTPEAFADPESTSTPLACLAMSWLAGAEIASARPRLQDVAQYTLLIQGKRSATTISTDRWLRTHGVKPASRLVCDNLIAQLGLAIAGAGICCLPAASLQPLLDAGKLHILADLPAPPAITYVARFQNVRSSTFLRRVSIIAQEQCDFSRRLILQT